jgi:hypothetical protein
MEASLFDPDDWLLHELTNFNGKTDRTTFPKEDIEAVFLHSTRSWRWQRLYLKTTL